MSALICGSMAYDNIMVFPGHFKEQILPDQIHILNVAFLVPEMRKEFGGCAGTPEPASIDCGITELAVGEISSPGSCRDFSRQ